MASGTWCLSPSGGGHAWFPALTEPALSRLQQAQGAPFSAEQTLDTTRAPALPLATAQPQPPQPLNEKVLSLLPK